MGKFHFAVMALLFAGGARAVEPLAPIHVKAERPRDPLLDAARAIADRIGPSPTGLKTIFSDSFLKNITEEDLAALLSNLYAKEGPVDTIRPIASEKGRKRRFLFNFKNGTSRQFTLGLDSKDPSKIGYARYG